MKIGIHVSIAGGMGKMARTAVEMGCETVQIFSRSPRGNKAKELVAQDVNSMKAVFAEHGIEPLVVHAPYYVNLASADETKRAYSVEIMAEDLFRAQTLGAPYVVAHMGHAEKDEDPDSEAPLLRVVDSINKILEKYQGEVKLLMENTAGQGRELGSTFESIASVMKCFSSGRVGTCFDTCHAYASGYDLSAPDAIHENLTRYDRLIGICTIGAIHLNDSKSQLGSRVDRHENIGKGHIGAVGLSHFIRSELFHPSLPALLETPFDNKNEASQEVLRAKALRNGEYSF